MGFDKISGEIVLAHHFDMIGIGIDILQHTN